ncbi:unnamed protein product [Boreogadus saida]
MAKRAAYFNEMELQVLLESYDEEKDIITRKGNAKASATRRTKAWQRIADRTEGTVKTPGALKIFGIFCGLYEL